MGYFDFNSTIAPSYALCIYANTYYDPPRTESPKTLRKRFWAWLDSIFPRRDFDFAQLRNSRKAKGSAVHGARLIPGARAGRRTPCSAWFRSTKRAVRALLA